MYPPGGRQYLPSLAEQQSFSKQMFTWNCRDDCRYNCMWSTVEALQERGYQIPKFHGKWPFKRWYGVQEPASVFACLLNLLAHLYMNVRITRQFPADDVPFVFYWQSFTLVCMNGWFWSIMFHTRDIPFNEFMDYGCALSMTIAFFEAAIIRVFHKYKKLMTVVIVTSLLYFANYLRYLYSGKIDYDHNMKVNLFFGGAGSVIWLVWACGQLVAGRRYVWRVVASTLLLGVAMTLELFDFPPIMDMWDAHALWHLSTVPFPLIFYRFVIDDTHYLTKAQKQDLKSA